MRRRSRTRPRKIRILICCEGRETEPNYFRALRREQVVRDRFVVEVNRGKGGSPADTVKAAIAARKRAEKQEAPFDEVWCVFDIEDSGGAEQARKALKLVKSLPINLARSNPSFEVWLLSHFERCTACLSRPNHAFQRLNGHWRTAFKREYAKNDEEVYQELTDRLSTAIRNARFVLEKHFQQLNDFGMCNPATEVYRLVERLLPNLA